MKLLRLSYWLEATPERGKGKGSPNPFGLKKEQGREQKNEVGSIEVWTKVGLQL